MPATFTVKQVADILGYSTNSIYTFLKAKRIKGVRVGVGRFRIPQSELDRLLLVKSGSSKDTAYAQPSLVASQASYLSGAELIQKQQESTPDFFVDPLESHGKVEVPSLFDWFVGVGSIILGLAMFLFSKSHEEFSSDMPWISMIRTIYITGGIGLLLSDIIGKKSVVWARIFRIVLVCAYAVYAIASISYGNVDVGILLGLLTPLIVMSFNASMRGLKLFILYVVSISIYFVFKLALQISFIATAVTGIVSYGIFGNAVVMSMALLLIFIVNRQMNLSKRILHIYVFMLSSVLIIVSFQYAVQMMWGRSLFVLMAGLFAIFIPLWSTLSFAHKRDRSFVFGVIGCLLLLFVFVIGGIRIMQSNITSVASQDLDNKVVYGKVSVESTLLSAKNSLASLALNPLLVDALENKSLTTLVDLSKTIVGVNTPIRRIVMLSNDGDIQAVYPYADIVKKNLKDAEYFARVSVSKQMVISGIFESVRGESKRKTVVIAVPVVNKKTHFVGMLVGTLDIDSIAMKLRQLTAESVGEYAVVVDQSARLIIYPDLADIGLEVDTDDPIRMGLLGKRGVFDGKTVDGVNALVAVDTVNDTTGWAIALWAPLSSVLKMQDTAMIVFIFLIGFSASIMLIFFMSHRKKSVLLGENTS